jgi:hypothetical protein
LRSGVAVAAIGAVENRVLTLVFALGLLAMSASLCGNALRRCEHPASATQRRERGDKGGAPIMTRSARL